MTSEVDKNRLSTANEPAERDSPSNLHAERKRASEADMVANLSAENERLHKELADFKHAFETTAADRDRLAQQLASSVEENNVLQERVANADTVARVTDENERLQKELEDFKHAFETTAIDRDRLSEILESISNKNGTEPTNHPLPVLSEITLGVLAHVLINEIGLPPGQVDKRLSGFSGQHQDWVALLKNITPNSPRSQASDGLLRLADFIMREAALSDLAFDLVETALALDDRFRGANHALWTYYSRKNSNELEDYFAKGVSEGAWPQTGTRTMQRRAIEQGIPSILLVTLPKSGSIFLASTIQASLSIPNFSIAVPGKLQMHADSDCMLRADTREVIVPELCQIFSEGGVAAQHHRAPSQHNLEQLKKNSIKRFILHIRDPRQSAVSWWHYNLKIGKILHRDWTEAEVEQNIWESYFVPCAQWMTDWLKIADTNLQFEIKISTQEEMAGREHEHISSLLDFMNIPCSAYTLSVSQKTDAAHFRKGATKEWLSFFSDDFKLRSLEHVPNELARRFGWQEIN